MENFNFSVKNAELQKIRSEVLALKDDPLLKNDIEKMDAVLSEKDKDEVLKIAVCGQYSAGKSTLLYALTDDKTIAIGQDVTTDTVKTYPWNGILLADTPGIYAGRQEHDQTSLDYIQKADLLIYMITIQGFTREIGDNFKQLVMEKYLAKTMLLMNKRNEEPAENEANWRKDTEEFLGNPSLLQNLKFTIVDIEDFLCGKKHNEPELIAESHFSEFIDQLNAFIQEKGLLGKILSRSNIIDAFLSAYIENFSTTQKKDEFTRRQKKAILHAITSYNKASRDASLRIRQNVKSLKQQLLNLLDDRTLREFQEKMDSAELELEQILDDRLFQDAVASIAEELRETFEEIDSSAAEYEQTSQAFAAKFPNVPVSQVVDLSMFKTGAGSLGKLLGTVTKDGVLRVAHFFGHSFKPWGATKCLKFVKGASNVLAFAAPVIDTISYVCDKKHQAEMEFARTQLRSEFEEIENSIDAQFNKMKNEPDSFYLKLDEIRIQLEKREQEMERQATQKKLLLEKLQEIKKHLDVLQTSLSA